MIHLRARSHLPTTALLALAAGSLARPAAAQSLPVLRDTVTIAPGPQFYTTSWVRPLGNALFGSRHRELWNTQVTLPVLDLTATAGGLRPDTAVTARDTTLLYLKGADGSHWLFWPVDRGDPRAPASGLVPGPVAEGLIADLASGRHPAGPLVAGALADSAGVPNLPAWLVVLPPDTALAAFDTSSTGRAGYLVRRDPLPTSDSTGPVEPGAIATSLTVLRRIRQYPDERVDGRSVLRIFLFDVFVGDMNPRFGEWNWEASPDGDGILWRPLGRFREGALARYNGMIASITRPLHPDLASFGDDYPSELSGGQAQRAVYRWLLASLDSAAWDSVAAGLQQRLTDSVISAAVAQMPEPYPNRGGAELARRLKVRRDRLTVAAEQIRHDVRPKERTGGGQPSEAVKEKWLSSDSLALGSAAERAPRGVQYHPVGWLRVTSGIGLLVGAGVVRTDWSGAARPYRSRVRLRAGYGTTSHNAVAQLTGNFHWAGSPLRLQVDAVASGVGAIYWYGLGNETPGGTERSYHRAGRDLYGLSPMLFVPLSRRLTAGAGLAFKWVHTPLDSLHYVGVSQPYGTPDFGEAGFAGRLEYDSRDVRGAPRTGIEARLDGAWYPVIMKGSGDFATATGSVTAWLTPPWWEAMTVAARVAGTATTGDVPYFESAFVGGSSTVRGLSQGRFNGDLALYGNLDLRLRVSRVQFVLPWDFGVLALADVGRVFVSGESSNVWHPSFGGGVWAAVLDRSLAAQLSIASGAGEGVFILGGGGFAF